MRDWDEVDWMIGALMVLMFGLLLFLIVAAPIGFVRSYRVWAACLEAGYPDYTCGPFGGNAYCKGFRDGEWYVVPLEEVTRWQTIR